MLRQAVKSANIKSIGYDEMKQSLEIEFMNGGVYVYFDVPVNVYTAVITAPSIGSAVHTMLKGKFTYSKV